MECFGQHEGARQPANLGDGNGYKDERVSGRTFSDSANSQVVFVQEVLREHFNIPFLGTCLQSLVGGNHLR